LPKEKSGKVVKISAEELKKDQGQSVANHFKYGGRC
jgi:hypothetical protein